MITAVSVADPTRPASATVTLTTVLNPTFTSIYPTHVGEGALFADVYLDGNGFPLDYAGSGQWQRAPGDMAFRQRLAGARGGARLSTGPGTLQFQVERQGAAPVNCTTNPCQLTIDAGEAGVGLGVAEQRSAGAFRRSISRISIWMAGYFGTSTANRPPVTAQFDGQTVSSCATPRQLSVTLYPRT